MEQSTLLTNERVIAITVSLITLLGSGFFMLLRWVFKKVMDEMKLYRQESLQQRSEFNDALNNKFKAINFYMKQTDQLQVKQEQSLDNFADHAREVKARLIKHEERLNSHSEKLASHEAQINILHKKG